MTDVVGEGSGAEAPGLMARIESAERSERWPEALRLLFRLPLTIRNAVSLTRRRIDVAARCPDMDMVLQAVRDLHESGAPVTPEERGALSLMLNELYKVQEQARRADRCIAILKAAHLLDPDNIRILDLIFQYSFHTGDSHDREMASAKIHAISERRAARDPLARTGFRFIEPSWLLTRIGEMATQLDMFFKMKALGWLPDMKPVLLAPRSNVVNAAFLDYWKPYASLVEDEREIDRLRRFSKRLHINLAHLQAPGQPARNKIETYKIVQDEWERQERAPLLTPKSEHIEAGWQTLRKWGLSVGDWFVCVHSREAGYLRDRGLEEDYHADRNMEIADFMPAIHAILGRGGWIIRVGDSTMRPLDAHDRVVDYALSGSRSDWMDMFLCSQCKFFMGTASGIAQVSNTFGVPVLYANMTPISTASFSSRDIFLPKLFVHGDGGDVVDFRKSLLPPLRHIYRSDTLRRYGYATLPTSPSDIRDAAIEMLDRLDGRACDSDEDELLQSRVRDLFRETDNVILGRIARDFLRRNRHLLDLAGTSDPA